MSASTIADVLLIAAAVVWVLARQVQLARVKARLLVLAPLVLAFFGIRGLPSPLPHLPLLPDCRSRVGAPDHQSLARCRWHLVASDRSRWSCGWY